MFRKIFVFVFTILLLLPKLTSAQEETIVPIFEQLPESAAVESLVPTIISEDFVGVGRSTIFEVATEFLPATSTPELRYRWNFGDRTAPEVGEEVVHRFAKVGFYTVEVTVSAVGTNVSATASKEVFIYDRTILLVTDQDRGEQLDLIIEEAQKNGVALRLLSAALGDSGFLSEDNLVKSLNDSAEIIENAEALVFYTRSAVGLQAFTRYVRDLSSAKKVGLKQKLYVAVADGRLDVIEPAVAQAFKLIGPPFILLTRPESLNPILREGDHSGLVDTLRGRGIEYRIVDERGEKPFYYFLSHVITSFVSKGISSNIIYLILIIPFLSFIVIFARQVVGLSTFGVFAPVMTAASFYILGIKFGLVAFLFVVVVSHLVKYVLNKFDLLYLPKVGLNLAIISLSFLIMLWVFLLLGSPVALSVAIFPMLLMSTVAEKFMAAQAEEGFRNAVLGVASTLLVVVAAYYLIVWTSFSSLLVSWPELVILPLLLTLLLGKFTGLRLGEYIRFRSLFSEHREE